MKLPEINFEKLNGLIPAVIQDKEGAVLMVGFMNAEAVDHTLETGLVTFFSRTKNRLWTKGETSGNFLHVEEIRTDCDNDSLLITVRPEGNVCHKGTYSCFGDRPAPRVSWLFELDDLVNKRKEELPEGSYTTKLFTSGSDRIIQKVGEEAVETVIAAKNRDKDEIINEVSDLFYHTMVMLAEQGIRLKDIEENLERRHK